MQRWLRPWWVLALVCLLGVAVLAGVVLLVWSVPAALYDYVPDPKDRAAAEASTRNGFIAGLAGLQPLAVTASTSSSSGWSKVGHPGLCQQFSVLPPPRAGVVSV